MFSLYVKSKKAEIKLESRIVVARSWGKGGDGQGVQTSSYKINKLRGSKVQHGGYVTILCYILGSC